jgi:hypothetical protein
VHSETFEEMFTYVGYNPKTTPEEIEESEKYLKEMDETYKRQMERVKKGLNFDGTERKYIDPEERKKRYQEIFLKLKEELTEEEKRLLF